MRLPMTKSSIEASERSAAPAKRRFQGLPISITIFRLGKIDHMRGYELRLSNRARQVAGMNRCAQRLHWKPFCFMGTGKSAYLDLALDWSHLRTRYPA